MWLAGLIELVYSIAAYSFYADMRDDRVITEVAE